MKDVLYVQKDTSQAEATLNNEKIKHVALAIVELRQSKGINKSVKQLVSKSVKIPLNNFLKFLWQLFESILSQSESLVLPN